MTLARRQDRKMANFRAGPFAYQGDSDALRGALEGTRPGGAPNDAASR